MAKVIVVGPLATLFDDGCFCGIGATRMTLGAEYSTDGLPRADTPLNPPKLSTSDIQKDWEWASQLWIALGMCPAPASSSPQAASEVCPQCKRIKDVGKRCWWCGC